MTTILKKTVKRKMTGDRWASPTGRPLVVALECGDMIAIKEHGRRTWYRIPAHQLFMLLARKQR